MSTNYMCCPKCDSPDVYEIDNLHMYWQCNECGYQDDGEAFDKYPYVPGNSPSQQPEPPDCDVCGRGCRTVEHCICGMNICQDCDDNDVHICEEWNN